MQIEGIFLAWVALVAALFMAWSLLARIIGDDFGFIWLAGGSTVLWGICESLLHFSGNHHKSITVLTCIGSAGSVLLFGCAVISKLDMHFGISIRLEMLALHICEVLGETKRLSWHQRNGRVSTAIESATVLPRKANLEIHFYPLARHRPNILYRNGYR